MRVAGWLFCLIVYLLCPFVAFSSQKREMRGAWIATVANIDWPSNKNSKSEVQKQEMILLLDSLRNNGINAVIFQCRPTSDALYKSEIEPWSEWLTGVQGKAPSDPLFDPLQFVIEESHKRCMEVHAWINPYRVTNTPDAKLSSDHIYYKKPHLFCSYGDKIYFNPGLKETEDHLIKVLRDLVVRYDVDALHLDDYFYPYPVAGKDFPDEETFKKNPRGFKNKADWRRDNVNQTVRRIHEMLMEEKPWVQFGISPFGVWRNKSNDADGSDTKAGVTNYDHLYADVLLWAKEGWIDYIAPQLYWEIGKKAADYEILAPWWRKYMPVTCNLYFGLYASGLEVNKTAAWKKPNELIRQLDHNRACDINVEGLLFYSTHYFLKNPQGLLDSLRMKYFTKEALPPEMKRGDEAFSPLNVRVESDTLKWDPVVAEAGDVVSSYVVYAFPDTVDCDLEDARYIVKRQMSSAYAIEPELFSPDVGYNFTVTSLNRFRKESEPYQFVAYRRSDRKIEDVVEIVVAEEDAIESSDDSVGKKDKKKKRKKDRKKKEHKKNYKRKK